ncbi:solute carrier family 15 member 4 [Plakobranchus ocellatus]|uniref:Solute carrier family 15 member 4 n=1 Tax=Plakobranchus ocellatus TaxID=259542 RepID=A0AAV4BHA0_9GAST|nr:solute carrier family 15 member 4 [Plakobranchus ocellatus]
MFQLPRPLNQEPKKGKLTKINLFPLQLPRASQNTQFSFFNWYYWCINCGSFIGLGLMSFLEQQYSFRLAFMVCATTLLVSVLVFCIGRLFYTCRAPDGSVLTNIFKILREAFRRWRQRRQMEGQTAPPLTVATEDSASNSTLIKTNRVRRDGRPIHFLDYAKHQHGGIFHSSLVDDVKKLGMIITVFAVLIPYWIVYFQMQTTFLFQGLHMRLDFYGKSGLPPVIPLANLSTASPPHANSHHFPNQTHLERPQIVAAWFSLFDAVFVIIMLPLFDRVIYPRLKQAGRPFTFTMRIVVGMVFAMTAILVAGVVEHYRLKAFWPYPDMPCTNASIPQYIAGTKYDAANMSVFWQIPQYALIGVSEVFTSVACLQFAVSVSPKSMKALITGIFYCFCGIGSFLGTAVLASLAASKTWIYSHNYGNINCRIPCHQVDPPVWEHSCHLDYYFYSLAGLEAVAIVLFIIVAGLYKLSSAHLVINANSQVTADDEDSQRRRRHIQVVSARGSMERQAPS